MINFYVIYSRPEKLDKFDLYASPLSYINSRYAPNQVERFKPILHIIKTIPRAASRYAAYVSESRWVEAEPTIMKDAYFAYWYAKYALEGRFIEAEPIIMKRPSIAVDYARFIIKGRWYEAEEYIIEAPACAYYYANDVIKGRWKEAEPYIMKDPLWEQYVNTYGIE